MKMAANQISAQDLIPKRNATAPAWEFFGFLPDENGDPLNVDKPICKICLKGVKAGDSNTSNLKAHLSTNHPLTYARMEQNKVPGRTATKRPAPGGHPGILSAFAKSTKYSRDSARWKSAPSL